MKVYGYTFTRKISVFFRIETDPRYIYSFSGYLRKASLSVNIVSS